MLFEKTIRYINMFIFTDSIEAFRFFDLGNITIEYLSSLKKIK